MPDTPDTREERGSALLNAIHDYRQRRGELQRDLTQKLEQAHKLDNGDKERPNDEDA